MNDKTHPVEQEEVMAYVDAQLDAGRAATVAAHLKECPECQALEAELRGVSRQAQKWQVEPAPARLKHKVNAALAETKVRVPLLRPWVWQLGAVAAVLMMVVWIATPNLLRSRMAADKAMEAARARGEFEREATPTNLNGAPPRRGDALSNLQGPMVIRTASLTIVTKEFENARAALEQILRKHGGHVAQLSASGSAPGGRSLTATVRVPAAKLDAALDELKKLGRVEGESQGGEEVTQQYVDLMARLTNARNTEKRLTQVLENRTGKVRDVLDVEREIARVREEIERMEAQRKSLENQVQFSTVQLRLAEEYQAQINPPEASAWLLMRNAAVDGLRSARENALGFVLFLLSYGPPLLFWAAVLFWPARLVWRRVRRAVLVSP